MAKAGFGVMMIRFSSLIVALLIGAGSQPASGESLEFEKELKPLLSEYCTSCHGKEKQKADINFEAYNGTPAFLKERKHWERVQEMVRTREMPPENKPQPSEEERAAMVKFIDLALAQLDCDGAVSPGRVTIRRLNRAEYNNTVRDLIGIDFNPAADFPSDDVGFGFDNIADLLSMPPILMEKYLAAAEQIATNAIVAEVHAEPPVHRVKPRQFQFGDEEVIRLENGVLGLYRTGKARAALEVPSEGEYVVTIRAFGHQAGLEAPRLAVSIDGKELKVFDVKASEGSVGTYEFTTRLKAGKRQLEVAYLNNYNVQDHADPKLNGDRNLFVQSVDVQGPADFQPAPLPDTHTRLIPEMPPPGEEMAYARKILSDFASRAYRRPAAAAEIERLVKFVELAKAEGGSFTEGIQLAVQAVLVSPKFLFRWELDVGQAGAGEVRPLNAYELASRLSYFLWSSMPDEELFSLAEEGRLNDPEVLQAQVRRMLLDPKSKALVENFAGQWLQLRNLEMVTPDPDLFPDFDEPLRVAMRRETELFFDAIMREDRSLLEFIDADFTFLNGRLAKHYGIQGIEGDQFQRVSLSESTSRGGILTHGSILTVTSNPTRTSPVNRGKWILEQILGSPPPPPPPDVPELPEEGHTIQSASLRERMEMHRANPDCATCHNKMDPLGFAFENFDAIGAWRVMDGRFPIDPSGTLPGGQSFNGPEELKQILKTQDTFVRTFIEKMLTYALGRGLEYFDKCAVDAIYDGLRQNEYRFSTLVIGIVTSDPFLMKQLEGDDT